jgi:hypothetical protein
MKGIEMQLSGKKVCVGSEHIWLPVAGMLIVVVGMGILFCELKDRYIPKRWRTVEAGSIFRSGQLSAALVHETLAKYRIRVVVDLTALDPASSDQRAELRACDQLHIEHRRFPLNGNGIGKLETYANAIASIQRAAAEGKPVLVHCAAGTQRTSGVVAAYRVLVQLRPANEVYSEMLDAGWQPGARQELMHFLNDNMGGLAALLLDRKTIRRIPNPLPRFEGSVSALEKVVD